MGLWILYQQCTGTPLPSRSTISNSAIPALTSGVLWGSANVMSTHATLHLGQAVVFPLSQLCVMITALWGIYYFRYM